MKKRSLLKNRIIWIVGFTIISVFTMHCLENKQVNNYKINQHILEKYFINYFFKDGSIATNPGNLEYVKEYATGNQVLSESLGLWMQYCVLKNDQIYFDKGFEFIKNKMLINDLIAYRYIPEGELFHVTSAIDDFRIVGELLKAERKWKDTEYKEKAMQYANRMYESIVQKDQVVDFYDIRYLAPGNCLTLCYADFSTMKSLAKLDERWQPVFENALRIVKEGYLGDFFPCFASYYNYSAKTYNIEQINMVQSLITSINLASIGECPTQTVDFIEQKVKNQTLFGSYSSNGEELDYVKSTAVYALAAILGNKTGNKELEDAAIDNMLQFQVLNDQSELYGAFADINTKDVYSFDNLNALIAMQMKLGQK
jgi:hypothetical protein